MFGKWGGVSVLALAIAMYSCAALAQQDAAGSLLGFWRQDGQSLIIEVVDVDGVFEATIVKDDWNPGMVGLDMFKELQYNAESKKWEGTGLLVDTNEQQPVTLKMKRSKQEFVSRMTAKPRKKIKWKRTDPVSRR